MRRYRDKLSPFTRALVIGAIGVAVSACSPSANWRVVQLDSAQATALLPCKPDAAQRQIPLQTTPVTMELRSCKVQGVTYAVAWARLSDPERGAQAVRSWLEASARSVGAATAPEPLPLNLTHAKAAWQWQAVGIDAAQRPLDVALLYALSGASVIQMGVYSPRGASVDLAGFWDGLSLPRP